MVFHFEWDGTLAAQLLVILDIVVLCWTAYLLARRIQVMRKPFVIFTMITQVVYIAWRILFTLPHGSTIGMVMAVLLLLAEALGAFQAITHRMLYLRDPLRMESRLPAYEDLPSMDVLICTYNEPAKVIEKTVAAAAALSYPRDRLRVFVCDDGRRLEIKQIAEKYGARWVTRPDNQHAKAGNLNNCLRTMSKAEFFLILDADVVVRSCFLERTMGYFYNPKVAFVQAPQVFYTPDPFQHNLKLRERIPNEQDYFMREIQPRRAAYNATLFVGSNGVFRRSYIDEIGLIPTESITEDIATSLLLEAKGYSGVTVDEVLAVGLSAESFADYVTQHERWGRGNIQVLKKYKPLTRKGLSCMQRLLYLDGILYWLFGFQKIIYIIGPIFFLLTGIPIFRSDLFSMLLFFVPTYTLSMTTFKLFSYRNRTMQWAHIYEVAMAPYMAISALLELLFSFRIKFKVTPKGQSRNRTSFSLRTAMPHIILTALSAAALVIGVTKLKADPVYMIPVYLLNLFWLLYNGWSLIVNIAVCFERPRLRASERLHVNGTVRVISDEGIAFFARLSDMSEGGCLMYVDIDEERLDALKNIRLYLPDMSPICGSIVRADKRNKTLGVRFEQLTPAEYQAVVRFVFDQQRKGYGAFRKRGHRHGPERQGSRGETIPVSALQRENEASASIKSVAN
ncbi:MAG: glycosyltransferase [Bacillota bacterium]